MGLRLLEVLSYRERGSRREIRLLEMLKFIHTSLWKCLFGRQARELEQSNTVSRFCYPVLMCCVCGSMRHRNSMKALPGNVINSRPNYNLKLKLMDTCRLRTNT